MKTITSEVKETVYKDMINFLRLLPKDSVRLLEDDSDRLSPDEQAVVVAIQARLAEGDDSEFEDWETVQAILPLPGASVVPAGIAGIQSTGMSM